MARTSKTGEKFTVKYGVEATQIYKGDSDALRIPGPDHPLYDPTSPTTHDPLRVAEIEASGEMTDALEVWTDPDSGTLWVIDGRSRLLDVREVNRVRKAEGRELVKPYIKPLSIDEKTAVARVRLKNYHRRVPTAADNAQDIRALRKAGWSWEDVVTKMHRQSDNPEAWCRSVLPLAFCEPEVLAAMTAGSVPRSAGRKFGGSTEDGSGALGRKEQLALLKKMTAEKGEKVEVVKALSPRRRRLVREALVSVQESSLTHVEQIAAKAIAAAFAFVDGDDDALAEWSDVAAIVDGALQPPVKGTKKTVDMSSVDGVEEASA